MNAQTSTALHRGCALARGVAIATLAATLTFGVVAARAAGASQAAGAPPAAGPPLAASASPAAAASPAARATGRAGTARYRKLDVAERARAIEQARQAASPALALRAARAAGRSYRSEVLLVERHRFAKGEDERRRLADVYLYDYEADHLCRAVVDLDHDRIDSIEIAEGVQLPLTEAERARALELALANPRLLAQLAADYRRATGQSLAGKESLEVSGFVYRADAGNAGSGDASSRREARVCGRSRCAQLMVRTPDGLLLELPVVDLSRERLLDADRFGLNENERKRRGRRRGARPNPTHDHKDDLGAHRHAH